MNKISNVKVFGCLPTLPSAYSDSLSYYEELSKLANVMNEIINVINSDFEVVVENAVDKYFNTIMISAMYVESTKTIVLGKETTTTDSDAHTYNYATETMTIGE